MQTEPARITGLALAAIVAVLDILVALHVITDNPDTRAALLSALTTLIPIIVLAAEFIRSKVYAPATVKRLTSGKRK